MIDLSLCSSTEYCPMITVIQIQIKNETIRNNISNANIRQTNI